jgi:hypothetical protein
VGRDGRVGLGRRPLAGVPDASEVASPEARDRDRMTEVIWGKMCEDGWADGHGGHDGVMARSRS